MNLKTTSKIILVLGLASLTSSLRAETTLTSDELLAITKLSFDDYAKANPEHAKHLSGFKTWISGEDGKVKIYIKHGTMAMEADYLCVRQATAFECSGQ